MERPGCIGYISLGLWFVRATEVEDKLLMYLSRAQDALNHIEKQGYNRIPDLLTKLKEFNQSLQEK